MDQFKDELVQHTYVDEIVLPHVEQESNLGGSAHKGLAAAAILVT